MNEWMKRIPRSWLKMLTYMMLSLLIAVFIYVLYATLMFILPPTVAYGCSYFAGIVFAFIANGKLVFDAKQLNLGKFVAYGLCYVMLLTLSVTTYSLIVANEIASIWWAPILSGACIYPLTYAVNAFFLTDTEQQTEDLPVL